MPAPTCKAPFGVNGGGTTIRLCALVLLMDGGFLLRAHAPEHPNARQRSAGRRLVFLPGLPRTHFPNHKGQAKHQLTTRENTACNVFTPQRFPRTRESASPSRAGSIPCGGWAG